MDDSHQIEIPQSFVTVYMPAGERKPGLPWPDLAARYEFCEDMAQLLTGQVPARQFDLGITENLALDSCLQGLLASPQLLNEAEARWVVCRLAELLNWPLPAWASVPVP